MQLTLDILESLLPKASDKHRIEFLEPLNITFKEFRINTPHRLASFMAQVEHESGSLHYTEELAEGVAYEYRKDLGNLELEALEAAHNKGTTTGKFYKGHGLLQITGFYNHKKCGQALGIDLVNNPELLCEPLYAARSAGWFWNTHNLNTYADVGLFGKITHAVNGGYNGAQERLNNYYKNCRILKIL